MNRPTLRLLAFVACLASVAVSPLFAAEETVTISKSRFQELERKEAELEKVKVQLHAAQLEISEWKKLSPPPPLRPEMAVTLARHQSPPMDSLPSLKSGEVVNALDLFNHFQADVKAASRRYSTDKLTVRGTIVGFEKPMFARPYHILLQTTDQAGRVVCKFDLPAKFNSAYTVKNGVELVAESGNRSRTTLAKVGEEITIQATCKGLHDGNVVLADCERR